MSQIQVLGMEKIYTRRPKAPSRTFTGRVGLVGFLIIESDKPVGNTQKKSDIDKSYR